MWCGREHTGPAEGRVMSTERVIRSCLYAVVINKGVPLLRLAIAEAKITNVGNRKMVRIKVTEICQGSS